MLASMIFRKEPFFHGHDNYDQVWELCYSASDLFMVKWFRFDSIIRVVLFLVRLLVVCFLFFLAVGQNSQGPGH